MSFEAHGCAQCWSVQTESVLQIKGDSACEVDDLPCLSLGVGLALKVSYG